MRHGGFGRTEFPTARAAASRYRAGPGERHEAAALTAPEASGAFAGLPLAWRTREPRYLQLIFGGGAPASLQAFVSPAGHGI
jgi:hypothetical protein